MVTLCAIDSGRLFAGEAPCPLLPHVPTQELRLSEKILGLMVNEEK